MHNNVTVIRLIFMFVAAFASFTLAAQEHSTGSNNTLISVSQLANVPGHSVTAVEVDLAPGLISPTHTHAGFVFVYVLKGTVRSQLNQGEIVEYVAGQSFVEPVGTVHSLTQNPSTTDTAKLLAIFVAKDDAELTHDTEHN